MIHYPGMCTDSMTLCWVVLDLVQPIRLCNDLNDPMMGKQGTAGKRKHVTLMTP